MTRAPPPASFTGVSAEVGREEEVVSTTEEESDRCSSEGKIMDQKEGPAAAPRGVNNSKDEAVASASSVENGSQTKLFTPGQHAYYRSPEDGILKVTIQYYGEYLDRYAISLQDGTQLDNIKPSQLSNLTDLSSKELSKLMKERNKRKESAKVESNSNTPTASSSKSSADNNNEDYARNTTDEDKKKLEEGGQAASVASCSEQKSTSQDSNTEITEPTTNTETTTSDTIQEVKMVQAKTESGGTKTVPLYEAGMAVDYTNAAGTIRAEILDVHLDDLMEPYYSIRLKDGREKQTDNSHIMLIDLNDNDGKDVQNEKEGIEDDKQGNSDGGDTGEETQDVDKKKEKASCRERRKKGRDHLIPRDSLKQMVEEQLSKADSTSEQDVNDTSHNKMSEVASKESPRKTDSAGSTTATAFELGDEVLYKSSNGEESRAVVVRNLRDKKDRAYHVIRLSDGKEKQVYGHRLKPYVKPENTEETSRRSQTRKENSKKSSRGRSSSAKVRQSSSSGKKETTTTKTNTKYNRSESIDSRRSTKSTKSTFSRSGSIDSRRSVVSNSSRVSNTSKVSNSSRASGVSRDWHGDKKHHRRSSSLRSANSDTRGSSKSRNRDRSHSSLRRTKSHGSASANEAAAETTRRDESRRRHRRTSSEDSRQSSSSKNNDHSHTSRRGRSRTAATPSVSVNSKTAGEPSEVGEDDVSKARSLSKLRSFRKSFAAMKKGNE